MFKSKKTKGEILVLLLMILGILFLNAISINANDSEKSATINETRTYHKGELRIVEGIPFVKLAGSYYEMGEQYGVLLKDRINRLYEELKDNSEWVSYAQQSKELSPQLEKLLSPRFVAYLKGMAAGSQVEYDKLVLGSFASLGCSSILKKIDSGGGQDRLLHARNMDSLDTVKGHQGIFELQPEGELKYITMGTIGLRIEDGLNERGISISVDDGDGRMRYKLPRYPLINAKMMDILSSAGSLADVDKQMTGYTSDIGSILIFGSANEKDGVIYDISYDKLRKNPMAGKEYLFVTNTYLHPDLTSPNDLLKCPRYQIINNYMEQGRVKTVDNLIDLLSDPGTSYGVNNFRTVHSTVYDPSEKMIYLSVASEYAAWGKWLRYDWQKDQFTVYREPLGESGPVTLQKTVAVKVASIRSVLPSSGDQTKLWAELSDFLKKQGIATSEAGFTIYYGNKGQGIDLEVVQPVDELGSGSKRVKFAIIISMEMACITHKGLPQTLQIGYAAIHGWIAENGYKIVGPNREIWLKGDWNEKDPREWVTEIQIPVKKNK